MNNFLFNSQSEVNLNSPQEVTYTSQSYFDTITQRLDSWHVKKQAIKEQKAQLTKSFLLKDTDTITGTSKTFRLIIELVSTEVDLDTHQLELMEVTDYAN